MMMLLLLTSCLAYPGHLFSFLPGISFLTSTSFTQKKVPSRVAHFYIILENAEGGGGKVAAIGGVVLQKERGHPNETGLGSNLGLLLTI